MSTSRITENEDTIAAISTPLGKSGIGIVRLSGPEAVSIVEELFRSPQGLKLEEAQSHKLHYGFIVDGERRIDEVLLSVMRSPSTYTREDVVEINCHGGVVPLRETLESVLDRGARLAEPGEFTKRAVLNGRITLDQARAVEDVIEAKTSFSLELSVEKLQGKFSRFVQELREELTDLLAKIDVAIDFPEYEDSALARKDLQGELARLKDKLDEFLEKSKDGKILKEGRRVAILGRPNVGKSTLLNRLLREERSIVTDTPGTTRDTVEESVEFEGIPFNLIDTAGLRDPQGEIERQGIDRARRQAQNAHLALFLIEADRGVTEEDEKIARELAETDSILLLNKVDKLNGAEMPGERNGFLERNWADILRISAKEGEGIPALQERMVELVWGGKLEKEGDLFLLDMHEKESLQECQRRLTDALEAARKGLSVDLIELDVRAGREALGRILGEDVSEAVLDRIFSDFCVGK